MDITRRKITKIAREVSRFTSRTLRSTGVGAAEYDLIHAVRKHPGITQKELSVQMGVDKSAVARQVANLIAKGYLIREDNPADGRSQLVYATEKANSLKSSRAHVEAEFYEWLLEELTDSERVEFASLIDRLYARCQAERQADFIHVAERIK